MLHTFLIILLIKLPCILNIFSNKKLILLNLFKSSNCTTLSPITSSKKSLGVLILIGMQLCSDASSNSDEIEATKKLIL